MLTFSPSERVTAAQALTHHFFDDDDEESVSDVSFDADISIDSIESMNSHVFVV
jgi:hypothetical protein